MDVSPDKQNVDRVFANTKYVIDFYQRDYRWRNEQVNRLLDDIFHRFNESYSKLSHLDPTNNIISSQYPWYYLNTYVTNTVDGNVYIVDGQQRLTTLSLILTKLLQQAKHYDSKLQQWIDSKIAGHTGYSNEFWIEHESYTHVQQALYEGEDTDDLAFEGITGTNLIQNYQIISHRLDKELADMRAFDTFVFFFLLRLVMIELDVEQTDVPMLFEAINDRGMRLRPHEILKGKLLGQIAKIELIEERYNELWENKAAAINDFEDDLLDDFFRSYLKGKHANTRNAGQQFDGDYHRQMFAGDVGKKLRFGNSPIKVKEFLRGDFRYYTELYRAIREESDNDDSSNPHLSYCRLMNLDAPFLLIFSGCLQNDPAEQDKRRKLAYEIDRYFALLQLQSVYDSNDFQDSLYLISADIRERPTSEYRAAFDGQIVKAIANRRNVKVEEPISYGLFRQTGINLNSRFKRYVFARVDRFLGSEMNLNPRHSVRDLVTKTGAISGFHVEHILSSNEENIAAFDGDEERFEQARNRLGGILLLKGKDNISSGNETYDAKLRTYANTLYWNETLRKDSYKSKLDMNALRDRYELDLRPMGKFGPDELESRHRLLFDLVRLIWA